MATANKHRGEVGIALAGGTRVLRPSFQCLCEIEAATGLGLVALAGRFAAGDYGFTEAAAIVAAGLRAAGAAAVSPSGVAAGVAAVSREEVGETILRDGLARLGPPVAGFLAMALGGPGRASAPAADGEVPYRRLLGLACGLLGWPPSAFWDSTLIELMDALDQWVLTNGAGEAAERLRYERFKEGLGDLGTE